MHKINEKGLNIKQHKGTTGTVTHVNINNKTVPENCHGRIFFGHCPLSDQLTGSRRRRRKG
jgi:hypothetical protein